MNSTQLARAREMAVKKTSRRLGEIFLIVEAGRRLREDPGLEEGTRLRDILEIFERLAPAIAEAMADHVVVAFLMAKEPDTP